MSNLVDALMAPEVRPFAVAAAVMIGVGLLEALSMLIGISIGQGLDNEVHLDKHLHVHTDSESFLGGLYTWFNAGRVPLLVLICLMLGIFAIEGFLLQGILRRIAFPLPASIAALVAAAGTIPMVRIATRGIARIIPRDETYVVSNDDLIGHIAIVTVGPLDQGLPGRVRVTDAHGNFHSLVARASPDSPDLPQGAKVLLVDRDARSFIAIAAPDDLTEKSNS